MTHYIASIELPAPADAAKDSELLVQMSALKFQPTIEGSGGKIYRLPKNVFVATLDETDVYPIRDRVRDAAKRVNPAARIIVVKGEAAWNLLTV